MKKYLQTNGKLKQSSTYTYAFNLPAIETCPNAGACKAFCFAAIEQNQYPQAMNHRQDSLRLSKSSEFTATIMAELQVLRKKHRRSNTKFAVRVHASGDFYNAKYMSDWNEIAHMNPDIQFYAYTKSIVLAKRLQDRAGNFALIYSMGGQLDSMIDVNTDRHARIFSNEAELIASGYVVASEDDTVAWANSNNKIGLIIFGAKRKQFNKVA
jgi:hypothetical protein